jgi:hypothetical protein
MRRWAPLLFPIALVSCGPASGASRLSDEARALASERPRGTSSPSSAQLFEELARDVAPFAPLHMHSAVLPASAPRRAIEAASRRASEGRARRE